MKKLLLIVMDGLGEKPLSVLGDKTPLGKANTPNLDHLAKEGICGEISPFWFPSQGYPRSDTAHLGLFGYDPHEYYLNRGPYEATGIGVELKEGDIALRANFGTVDEDLKVVDRRAGRISETESLVKSLSEIKDIEGVEFLITKSWGHRAILVMRGDNLSSKIEDPDPHKIGLKVGDVKASEKEAEFTSHVLTEYLKKAHEILKNHPLNKKRKEDGELVANYLLLRGAGEMEKTPSFKERYGLNSACIAGGALYKGIARIVGMDLINVEGADGSANTNIKGKFQKAKEILNNEGEFKDKEYNFIFLHIKATDCLAEDGDYEGKKNFIERIDKEITPLFELQNSLIAITADHCTCCDLKRHCVGEVPLLISGDGKDSVENFSEKTCKEGGIGRIESLNFMKKFIELSKKI